MPPVIELCIDLCHLLTERFMTTHSFPTDPKIDALIERFPRLFRGAQPLVWSDLPQGWAELTDRLFADIDRMLDDTAAKAFQVLQNQGEVRRIAGLLAIRQRRV